MNEQRLPIVGTELRDQYATISTNSPYKRYLFWKDVYKLLRVSAKSSDAAIQHAAALSTPRNISIAIRAAIIDEIMVRSSALMAIAEMVRQNPSLRDDLPTITKWEKRKILRDYRDNDLSNNARPHISAVIQAIIDGTKKPARKQDPAPADSSLSEMDYPVIEGTGRMANLDGLVPQ